MADLIQMLIEVLRIDCSVVNCYYTNQIDAIFNLFFFPTVFILLIIYLLLNYILDEVRGGLRLLIAIALYAVIVINGLMTLFIPLSQFWWIVLLIVFGAWVFFTRLLFKEKKGGGGGLAGALAGGATGGVVGYMAGKAEREIRKDDKREFDSLEREVNRLREHIEGYKKGGPDSTRLGSLIESTITEIEARLFKLKEVGLAGGLIDPDRKRAQKIDDFGDKVKKLQDEYFKKK
jgi:hypothetical protein